MMATEMWRMDVIRPNDKETARSKSKSLARQIGFQNEDVIEEIAIVVSELASNLIKYAKSGKIIVSSLNDNDKKGIQLESIDNGPGIEDIELAMVDGFSTSNSLGFGLGTINRLMDELNICSQNESGTDIIVKKWISDAVKKEILALDFGGASRPYPGIQVNGDAFIIKRWKENILVSVIDGLGHGILANRASNIALNYIKKNFDQPINQIIRGVHLDCRNSRGVVIALAKINLITKEITFAGVGNIEVRTLGNAMKDAFLSRRGILGRNIPTIRVVNHYWEPGFIMVLFSDGINPRWRWEDFSQHFNKSSKFVAITMLEKLARDNDDATVVVIKEHVETT